MTTVGLVGQGAVADVHARAWRRIGVDLHVVAHSDATAFAERHGARTHSDLTALLAAVDVLDVCTPTPTHAQIVEAGLAAGLDVICEKPLAADPVLAAQLARRATEASRLLLPAHVVRYFDAYHEAHEVVAQGRLGALAVLRFSRSGEAPTASWYADAEASGGIILDQMIHDIDQALWFAGPAERVYAALAEREGTSTAHVVITHRSGAISHCRGYWGAPGTDFRFTFDIAGTGGILEFDSTLNTGMSVARPSARSVEPDGLIPTRSLTNDPYEAQLRDFLTAITSGTTPRVSATDGVAAVAVAVAALRSVESGQPVALDAISERTVA